MLNKTRLIVKQAIAAAIVFVMVFALFGCAGGYVKDQGVLPENYVPTPSGKVKVQYMFGTNEAEKRSMNDWIKAFNAKYPDVNVNVEFNVNLEMIAAQVASRTVGDVFFLDETQVYNYAVVHDALMPLDYYVEAYGIDLQNIFSAILDMGICEGKLYMVMRDYNHMCLNYNKDLIREANLIDPVELESRDEWTWETFKEYCHVLTTPEDADTKVVGATMPIGYAPVSVMFVEGWGGKYYDTENKKVFFKSDERVVQGISEACNIVMENVLRYEANGGKAIQTAATSRVDFSSYQPAFSTMVFISLASTGRAYEQKGIDWDVVSMPATPVHKVGTGATGFVVFNGTKNRDAAAALALSLYTEEGQKAYNGQEGGSVPNVKSLADSSFWRVPFADNRDDPENGKNYYAFISYPEADTYGRIECVLPPDIAKIVTDGLKDIVPNVVNGAMTLDDALERIESQANAKWETLYSD